MASAEEKARPSHSCQSCRNLLTSIPDNPPRLCLTQLNCYVEDGCALFKWVISRAKKHYGENLASDTQVWFSRFGEYDEATKEYRDSSEAIVVSIDSRGSGQRQITEPLMLQAQEGRDAEPLIQVQLREDSNRND